MKNKRTTILVVIIGALVLIALFAWPKINNPARALITKWEEGGVECLTMGHTRTAQHFHPHLTIVVDGAEETIPANSGVVNSCMAEMHTHDGTGTIHVEAVSSDKVFYLKNFLTVYDKPLERDGYLLTMTVDGQPNTELGELVLKDKQEIVIEYKSISN